ncbi:MAG: hypothetical protein ACRDPY_32235 [Streptosporangiaceae bacterium]
MPTRTAAKDERREKTLEHLRSTVPADAARAAEAIAAAVHRLGVVDLLRAAVLISTLADLASDDTDGSCSGAPETPA